MQRREVVDGYRLVYIGTELVNWCPGLGTVLANEEVTAEGRSDIGNYPVYRRPLRQWMLRISAYAQRLIDDLDRVDWPESIKIMQRNWIGASDGAAVGFPVARGDGPGQAPGAPGQELDGAVRIGVFTTRPDTLPGATCLVLAPEHPLVGHLVTGRWPEGTPPAWRYPQGTPAGAGPAEAVAAYRAVAARLSDRQRAQQESGKTGVFTGSYVINPMTGERIPVFVADYVLMGYGTGAIMAVPAHDDQDLVFARAFGLRVGAVLAPPAGWLASHGLPPGAPASQWPAAFSGEGNYLDVGIPGLSRTATLRDGIEAAAGSLASRGFRVVAADQPLAGVVGMRMAALMQARSPRQHRRKCPTALLPRPQCWQSTAGPPVPAAAVRRHPHDHHPVQQLRDVITQPGERLPALRAAVPVTLEVPDHREPGQMRVIPPPRPRPRAALVLPAPARAALPLPAASPVITGTRLRTRPLQRPPEQHPLQNRQVSPHPVQLSRLLRITLSQPRVLLPQPRVLLTKRTSHLRQPPVRLKSRSQHIPQRRLSIARIQDCTRRNRHAAQQTPSATATHAPRASASQTPRHP